MKIESLTLGPLQTNCYIVSEEGRDDALIIDPADSPSQIRAALGDRKAAAVLLTHGHFDHTGALSAFAEAPIYIHEADAAMLTDARLSLCGMVGDRRPRPSAARAVRDGDVLTLAGMSVEVLHTPGHTPGSVCYRIGGCLFSGDTMFRGSCGRTDFPGGSWADMLTSLCRLKALPGDLTVFPGHGDTTTIAAENRTV